MSHTPGPWKLKRGANGEEHGSIVGPDGHLVATTGYRVRAGATEDDANARVISAAPELLAALEELHDWCQRTESPPDAMVLARAAIAKARGGR